MSIESQACDMGDVTLLLRRWGTGELDARGELFSLLYPELRRIAECRFRSERRDHTLQPTALVSEFFLRLARQSHFTWRDRAHFLAVASQVMRRLLIDYARSHNAESHWGGLVRLEFEDIRVATCRGGIDAIEFDDLLDLLAAQEPRMARVAEMRCFGGLTHSEIAEALGVDERTVKRDWQVAGAWLRGKLRKGSGNERG
jgi:RNA polymerase sigma factor (TIGR02999 family)